KSERRWGPESFRPRPVCSTSLLPDRFHCFLRIGLLVPPVRKSVGRLFRTWREGVIAWRWGSRFWVEAHGRQGVLSLEPAEDVTSIPPREWSRKTLWPLYVPSQDFQDRKRSPGDLPCQHSFSLEMKRPSFPRFT